MRALIKSLLPRFARTAAGKHVVHGSLAADRRALRFTDLDVWPERVGGFEDIDFMFTSSQLDHGIASLRFDEAALLYRTAASLESGRIVELGRFKGGSTFIMGVAKRPGVEIWSCDLHVGHPPGVSGADLDAELGDALARYGIGGIDLVVGDTRTVVQPDSFEMLFIDADHSYAGARADFERWSPRRKPGGHLLFHDAVDTGGWGTVYPELGRLVSEIEAGGVFRRLPGAGTIAHFMR